MLYFFHESKSLPFLFRKGRLFLLIVAILFITGCDSKGLVLRDFINIRENSLFMAGSFNGKETFLTIQDDKIFRAPIDENVISSCGTVETIRKLTDTACAVITQKNGIFIMPLGQQVTMENVTHLPVSKESLLDKKIHLVYYYEYNDARKLFVVYDTKNIGLTEIAFTQGWTPASYTHYKQDSSELKSNNIKMLEIDPLGHVWIVYGRKAKKGVSRISPDGEWAHYDYTNSELPDKYVNIVKAEKTGTGLNRENVWFGSSLGITRMQYRLENKNFEDREKWKHYGERGSTKGSLSRAFGFGKKNSDTIYDILDINIIDRFVIIANLNAVYSFNGRITNRFIPDILKNDNTGDARIYDILCRGNFIIVKITPVKGSYRQITSFIMLDLEKRKWHEFNIWKMFNNFPENIYCMPYRNGLDFVIVEFTENNYRFCLLDFNSKKLTPIELPVYAKLDDIPFYQYAAESMQTETKNSTPALQDTTDGTKKGDSSDDIEDAEAADSPQSGKTK